MRKSGWLTAISIAVGIAVATSLAGCRNGEAGSLTTSGTIQATEVPVATEVAGKVAEVLVNEGDRVRKGDVVARLDTTALEIQLRQAKGALDLAEARLAEARAGSRPEQVRQAEQLAQQADAALAGAQKNYDAISRLYRDGAASKTQLDAATTQLESAAAAARAAHAQADLVRKGPTPEQVKQLEAAVEQARAAVDLAQFNLDRAAIRAPVGGVVTRRLVEPGAMLAVGAPVATLASLDDLWLKVYVPENRLNLVRLGAGAVVTVDAYPGRTFRGEVFYIADQAEFTPRNVQTKEERATTVYAVKLRLLDGLNGELKPGMPVDVTFRAEQPPQPAAGG